ncbi:MAG: 1,2-phenylacetyl-CoA epoxidase subunit PaaC [Nocardioidaceae bacterium]|nr:1,2-phenylacetyl-CoA epoxidase subunit PaaC [Nocardioidaceae bacterium]
MDHDNAYDGLVETQDDARWAFGTGFDDPLAGVDTTVPTGVDGAALAAYCLMLGDDALVSAQRLAQWSTRAPELEEEVALANIGLDLLGQARLLLARAAAADPSVVPPLPEGSPVPSEDALAFFRDAPAFRPVHLTQVPNGDFAVTVVRLTVLSTWRLEVLRALTASRDPVLAAVAEKGVKELSYHRDYAARWCVTLAQGTAVSRSRLVGALGVVWPYLAELSRVHPVERSLVEVGVAADPSAAWLVASAFLDQVLAAGDLEPPGTRSVGTMGGRAGRDGAHTEWLGPLLDEMQVVARAHPMGRW